MLYENVKANICNISSTHSEIKTIPSPHVVNETEFILSFLMA